MRIVIAALLLATAATGVQAQNADAERRIDRLEREIRALQRQVFPGGNGEFFEPDIQAGQRGPQVAGNPASAPITDLTDRLNALERQLANLTGQVEENGFRLRQIEAQLASVQRSEPMLDAEDLTEEGGDGETVVDEEEDRDGRGSVADNLRAMMQDGDEAEAETPTAENATPFRSEGSDPPLPADPGEASYVIGYRLWRDGDYEAARAQLRQTIEDYPGHRFESYARNLLGRAFLDDDKPASATEIFLRNYQEIPNGERAADSLYFLGIALHEQGYSGRACRVFDELAEVYGADLRSTIAEQVPAARTAARCP